MIVEFGIMSCFSRFYGISSLAKTLCGSLGSHFFISNARFSGKFHPAGRDVHPLFKRILKLHNLVITNTESVEAAKNALSSWVSNGKLDVSRAYDYLRVKHESKQPWMKVVWKSFVPPA